VKRKEKEMKKFMTMGVSVLFFTAAILTVAYAGPMKGWKGSAGWGYGAAYNRMYDPNTVVTVKGTVEDVEHITPMKGMSYGVHLKLKTDTETISVHLGPGWFVERQDMTIAKGDTIEVTGSKITFKGAPAIIAADVKKGETLLKLRDGNAMPLWAGARMMR
jgi:hypothetical protein